MLRPVIDGFSCFVYLLFSFDRRLFGGLCWRARWQSALGLDAVGATGADQTASFQRGRTQQMALTEDPDSAEIHFDPVHFSRQRRQYRSVASALEQRQEGRSQHGTHIVNPSIFFFPLPFFSPPAASSSSLLHLRPVPPIWRLILSSHPFPNLNEL